MDNQDLTIDQLIDRIIKKLNLSYGRIEIKVHKGDWTNCEITERINKDEVNNKEFFTKKIKKQD